MVGAPLEDGGSEGTAGGHWEKTKFNDELMTGWISTHSSYPSTLTLKFFEDSGWYIPDYDVVAELTFAKDYGCDFFGASYCDSQNSDHHQVCSSGWGCSSNFAGLGYCGEVDNLCKVVFITEPCYPINIEE